MAEFPRGLGLFFGPGNGKWGELRRFGSLRSFPRRKRLAVAAAMVVTALAVLLARSAAIRPDEFAPTSGTVRSVIDGDTLHLTNGARVRLLGMDAPELGGPEDALALEAKNALTGMVANRLLRFEYGRRKRDRYGRWLAYCILQGNDAEIFVNAEIVLLGLARVYPGASGSARRSAILAAEDEARSAGRGIWAAAK